MSGLDEDILEIFREEARERIDRIVGVLLALEAGDAPADAIDSIFRDAHSIKGSAAMVGLDEARTLAHSLEDTLGAARGSGVVAAETISTLLAATDELRRAACDGPEPGPGRAASRPVAGVTRGAGGRGAGDGPGPATEQRRSIRMPTSKVDRLLDAAGESVVQARRVEHVLRGSASANADDLIDWELGRGRVLLADLQQAAIGMRTLPLASITGGYARAVRDVAVTQGKEVSLEIIGAETQLDRVILDGLSDAIAHLLRNAIAHGIELPEERERAGKPRVGRISLLAVQQGSMVAVGVADDGRGVDAALLARAEQTGSLAALLSEPGLSTAAGVTEVAGRGVGLDAVRSYVHSFAGSMEVESQAGQGTTVTLVLPYSVALMRVLLVERGGQVFGIPLPSVEEVTFVERPLTLGGSQEIEVRGRAIPLCDLATILRSEASPLSRGARAVVVSSSERRQAVACARIVGEQEVVVKTLGGLLAAVPGYLGAAILDCGAIAPILDPAFITRRLTGGGGMAAGLAAEPVAPKGLVVDIDTVEHLLVA